MKEEAQNKYSALSQIELIKERRLESARVIAGLPRLTRDVGLAEDLAQEALVAALEQWPQSGVPFSTFNTSW